MELNKYYESDCDKIFKEEPPKNTVKLHGYNVLE